VVLERLVQPKALGVGRWDPMAVCCVGRWDLMNGFCSAHTHMCARARSSWQRFSGVPWRGTIGRSPHLSS
jgi:hypothetical protein